MERHFCLDDSPRFRMMELDTIDSTSNFLKQYRALQPVETTLVTAEFQTHGRGSAANTWESERGRNLLFSLQIHPSIPATQLFAVSEVTALAVREALAEYADGFCIKWPNDIYWHDRKVVGMLIENNLSGSGIQSCIIGVGININQTEFLSDAPNPVSLAQITGEQLERRFVLEKVMERFTHYLRLMEGGRLEELHQEYLRHIYRWRESHRFQDEEGEFEASIVDVEPTGLLVLRTADGALRKYEFKEVKHVI